ncbi:unnamed protein product, partial [Prorocentrum cordatum]
SILLVQAVLSPSALLASPAEPPPPAARTEARPWARAARPRQGSTAGRRGRGPPGRPGAQANGAVQPRGDLAPPPAVEEVDEVAQLKLLLGQVPGMRAQEVLLAMAAFVTIDVRLAGLGRLEELQREGAQGELLPLGCVEAVVEAMEVHNGPGCAALQESGIR